MRRVLIITYYWPPSGGSGVQRWVKFSKYLPEFGWQPVIYTPSNPDAPSLDYSLEKEISSQTEVIKRPIREIYSLYRKLTGAKAGVKSEVNPINQNKSLKSKILMAIRGNFFIPDPRVSWKRPSVKFLKKYLQENPVDVIVSTGPPHSMHLIAKELSKQTGVPWVADFRDPWTKMFYFKHLGLSKWAEKKHIKQEKAVLDAASVVVAVSPMVKEEFEQMTDTKVELITNGYDKDDFAIPYQQDGKFNITHTGLFASDGNPDVLWKILGNKCREDSQFASLLRIRLTGKTDKQIIDSIISEGLEGNLIDLAYQDHKVAVAEQLNSSMLILPLRKEPEYKATLPGKLFEYLASGRKILGIGQKDGAMARIIEQTSAGTVCDWSDEKEIKEFIEARWNCFIKGEADCSTGNTEKYSREALSHSMAQLFNSLI